MVSSVHTFALIKALYDEGQDYIDSFWPFAVKVIPVGRSPDTSSIQRGLRARFDLDVPLHVIGVILTRAERKGYVRQWRDRSRGVTQFRLTDAGADYASKLETDREVERRINALLESIRSFFNSKGVLLSFDKISALLLDFVHENIDFLIECINPSISSKETPVHKSEGYEKYLPEYVESADKKEPSNYEVLEDVVMGSIISALLCVEDPEDITRIRTMKFSDCRVFLDTNFIFSMLGLHMEEFNEPARELLDLLKKYDFDLKVFNFTLDEISRVLNSYHREYYRYPTNVEVNTLYSSLKRKGWSKTDAREFIINIEGTLEQHGIAVEWMKDINLTRYTSDDQLNDAMKKYKPGQDDFHRNHDMAAIAKVNELRGRAVRRIEDSGVLFLTSDVRLCRFNLLEMKHKENGTICETILDRLLTNILWLKNPNTKPPLKSIIAAHSRDLFVNRRVWDRFYEVLRQLKREGKIKDDAISTLFWHSYVEDALRSIEETEIDKITPEFVLDEIEKAGKQRAEAAEKKIEEIQKNKAEVEEELKRKEREFSEHLEKSISDAESRKEREWLEKIQGIKESLREHSQAEAAIRSTVYILFLTIVFIVVVAVASIKIPSETLDLILTVVGGGGLIGLWLYGRNTIKSWLAKRIYGRKLKEAKLDEI
jgi:predicted nucleic acid-binding protein